MINLFTFQTNLKVDPDDLSVRLGAIYSRAQLFEKLSTALKFPDYFGENWDALDECLRDFHWVEQRRVVIQHDELPRLSKGELHTYLEILQRAVEDWHSDEQHELVVIFPKDSESIILNLLKREETQNET